MKNKPHKIDPERTYNAYELRKLGIMISPLNKKPLLTHSSIKNRLLMNGYNKSLDKENNMPGYAIKGSDLIKLNEEAIK